MGSWIGFGGRMKEVNRDGREKVGYVGSLGIWVKMGYVERWGTLAKMEGEEI